MEIAEIVRCTSCLMDTSDPLISFNADGVCNHCLTFQEVSRDNWFPNEVGQEKLSALVKSIRDQGKGKRYDCIIGLSGGIDSSFLALKVHKLGLRPLVVHVDAGWNTELAVNNIEALVNHCGYDLHTHVVNWDELRELQLAYLRSGVSNQDVPQDHIFFSSLYHFACKNGIRYILSGGNLATEGIFPSSWHGSAMDEVNLRAIFREFGRGRLKDYKTISFFDYYIYYPFFKRMRVVRPLNFMRYNKAEALKELQETVGYKPYARKHGESLFTKLFQNYYLPTRFGFDKRVPHLSSLVVSGQMTRDEGLAELEKPLYTEQELESDISYFCKKLHISRAEFDVLMQVPKRDYTEFPNWNSRLRALKSVHDMFSRLTGRRVKIYS